MAKGFQILSNQIVVNVESSVVGAQIQGEDSSIWAEPSTISSPKRRTDAKPSEYSQQSGTIHEACEVPTHTLSLSVPQAQR